MFKNRYFIMGLGCGIMIGVLLLQMIWTGQQMTPTLSKEQLEQEAKRQGYELVIPDNNQKENLLPSSTGSLEQQPADSEADQANRTAEQHAPSSEADETIVNGNLQPEQSTENNNDTAEIDKTTNVETNIAPEGVKATKQIRIKPNLTSSQIALQLADDGVIDNASEFEAYIKAKKKQTQLRAGYFIFDVPSSYENALTTLISHPNG